MHERERGGGSSPLRGRRDRCLAGEAEPHGRVDQRFAMALLAGLLGAACGPRQPIVIVPIGRPVYEFRDGRWFDGSAFQRGTRYVYYGRVSRRQPTAVDSVVDLHGAWVVPAYGRSLRDGADATFLVLAGDPVADIANTARVVLVVQEGRLRPP
jgi:hypothetical protein